MLARVLYSCGLLCLLLVSILCLATLAIIEPYIWGSRVGSWYVTPQSTPQSDVIVVLGGSTSRRVETAIGLYQNGIASQLLITGHDPADPEDWEKDRIKQKLIDHHIPESDVLWMPSGSTLEDSHLISNQVQSLEWLKVLVVSDWYHARRAMCTINHTLLEEEVQVAFVSAEADFTMTNWWQSEDGVVALMTEGTKLLYYSTRYNIPLGGCWKESMNLIKVFTVAGLGLPLSFILVIAVRWYTLRKNKLDTPNARSSHEVPTPLGGGLAIALVTLTFLLIGIFSGVDITPRNVFVLVGVGALIAIIGLVDDWWQTLSAKTRLVVHFSLTLIFIVITGAFTELYLPVLGVLYVGPILGGAITLVWIVGLINVYNFMDGSDGLAGTQAFLAGSIWAILFVLEGQETLAILCGLLASTSLGFLFWNVPPAKIFMGDVGSTFLGFSLSAVSVIAFAELKEPRLLVTGGLMVGVFVFDATFTILRRFRNGENLLEAHHSHLYQRLIELGYSHGSVCVKYAVLMALSASSGLIYYFAESEIISGGVLIVALVSYVGLAAWVTWLESDRSSVTESAPGTLTSTHQFDTK